MNTNIFLKLLGYFSIKAETILGVFLVGIIGLLIIKKAELTLTKAFSKTKMDPTLNSFLKNLVSIVLKMVLLLTVLSMSGVKIASLLAVLGAASLALGLSLQTSLSNIAGGVILLILRPFRVGDIIDTGVMNGRVHAIQIFNTVIKSQDNKTIYVPNAKIIGESIVNHTIENKRRIDITLPVSNKSDIKVVKSCVQEILNLNEAILKDPEPTVNISEWAGVSLPITIRAWCKGPEDIQHIKHELIEAIKVAFDAKGIELPTA
jgi:small conductance mechanosensitive channel